MNDRLDAHAIGRRTLLRRLAGAGLFGAPLIRWFAASPARGQISETPGSPTPTLATPTTVKPIVVTGVSPNTGPCTGGTTVTISGSGFKHAIGVKFGTGTAVDGVNFKVVSDSTITVTTPQHVPGKFKVRVIHA